MNPHLSSEGIWGLLIGDAPREDSLHAQECGKCGDELDRMAAALGLFRETVQRMAQRDPVRLLVIARPVRRREAAAALSSFLFHGAAIAGILVIGSLGPVRTIVKETVIPLLAPDLKPYLAEKHESHGGGGGGTRSAIEAKRGALPKSAPRQFVPPQVDPPENPKLPVTPTIPADAPTISAANLGDPLSHLGLSSNGPGCCNGIGNGDGTGVGVGHGPGAGDGRDGGFFGGAYQIGKGVTAPVVLTQIEPEYSDEARLAKWQGTVRLQVVVDEHGIPRQMKLIRALGLGLDQKAMEAVAKWRFRPGTKNGKPVPVIATIDVSFRLL